MSTRIQPIRFRLESTNAEVIHSKANFEQFLLNGGGIDPTLHVSNEPGKYIGMLSFDKNVRLFECRVQETMFSTCWLNLYRRDFIERNRLKFPAILSEDEAWTTVICCFADRLFCINEPFYVYRKRHGSTMTQINHERAMKGLRSIIDGIRYLDKMFDRAPTVSTRIKNECIQAFTNRLMTNFVLRCYQPNELSGDDLIKYFVQALRPRFAEDSELIAYFLQGLAMQNAWRMNLQIQLINLSAGRPAPS